jgi:hypothetical protein
MAVFKFNFIIMFLPILGIDGSELALFVEPHPSDICQIISLLYTRNYFIFIFRIALLPSPTHSTLYPGREAVNIAKFVLPHWLGNAATR